jgi:hypothetical protein
MQGNGRQEGKEEGRKTERYEKLEKKGRDARLRKERSGMEDRGK